MLTNMAHCEDAAIVRVPAGAHLVQSLDFFTPIVNDPYYFGQIAAANALSDIYAMGGTPYVVMNIVCFPLKTMAKDILKATLRGGLDKIQEAGAMLVGGHSIQDEELKYGLSVTGYVPEYHFATNSGLKPGDILLLTKPIGSGVLATAIKADWAGAVDFESELIKWAARLNKHAGQAIQKFKLAAATDITGFGLGGHLLEMAGASNCSIRLQLESVPFMQYAMDLASVGLIPAGSYANKHFCSHTVDIAPEADLLRTDLVFDAQTSGGMVLAVPEERARAVADWLCNLGEMAVRIGTVESARDDGKRLLLC